jgi:hypothetical protein
MASHMTTSYEPQTAQVNEKPPPESSLDLTLIQHLHDEILNYKKCAFILKLNPIKLDIISFFRTFTPW